jgi:hypothetical protein
MQRKNDNYEGNIEISKLLQAAAKKLEVYAKQLETRYTRSNSAYTRSSSQRYLAASDIPIHGDDDTALVSKVPTKIDLENMLRHAADNKIRELKLCLSMKIYTIDTCCLEKVRCHLYSLLQATILTYNLKIFRGYNILTVAAWYGNIDIVKYLVESRNANIMYRQHDGVTPIFLAAQNGYLDCVKYMLDRVTDLTDDQVGNIPYRIVATHACLYFLLIIDDYM